MSEYPILKYWNVKMYNHSGCVADGWARWCRTILHSDFYIYSFNSIFNIRNINFYAANREYRWIRNTEYTTFSGISFLNIHSVCSLVVLGVWVFYSLLFPLELFFFLYLFNSFILIAHLYDSWSSFGLCCCWCRFFFIFISIHFVIIRLDWKVVKQRMRQNSTRKRSILNENWISSLFFSCAVYGVRCVCLSQMGKNVEQTATTLTMRYIDIEWIVAQQNKQRTEEHPTWGECRIKNLINAWFEGNTCYNKVCNAHSHLACCVYWYVVIVGVVVFAAAFYVFFLYFILFIFISFSLESNGDLAAAIAHLSIRFNSTTENNTQ